MFEFKSFLRSCAIVFLFIGCGDIAARRAFNKARHLEAQQKYRTAIDRYEAITRNYPKSQFGDSARIAQKLLTSPQFISEYVKNRLAQGIKVEEALGEFAGLKVIWLAKPIKNCIRKDLEGEPIEFKVGETGFLGVASYGLDRLKFNWFCTSNEEQFLTIEGLLIRASEQLELPITVSVNAVARQ